MLQEAHKYFHARATTQGLKKLNSSPWLLSALIIQDEAQSTQTGQAGGRSLTQLMNLLSSLSALLRGEPLPISQPEELEFSVHRTGVSALRPGWVHCPILEFKSLSKVVKVSAKQ